MGIEVSHKKKGQLQTYVNANCYVELLIYIEIIDSIINILLVS